MPEIEEFEIECDEGILIGSITIFDKSCWIWVSELNNKSFGSLDVSMPSRFETMPLHTSLIQTDDQSFDSNSDISQRLSKRFDIQIFMTGHVTELKSQPVEIKLQEILNKYFTKL
jgi:hypothetical protein